MYTAGARSVPLGSRRRPGLRQALGALSPGDTSQISRGARSNPQACLSGSRPAPLAAPAQGPQLPAGSARFARSPGGSVKTLRLLVTPVYFS